MSRFERILRGLVALGGAFLMAMGALIIWRDFNRRVPIIGWENSRIYILGGAFFILAGFLFLVIPPILQSRRRRKEEIRTRIAREEEKARKREERDKMYEEGNRPQ